MVVPLASDLAESLEPVCLPLHENAELDRQYQAWMRARADFLTALHQRRPDAVKAGWQKDYSKGVLPGGARSSQHRTRLHLKEFKHVVRAAPVPQAVTFHIHAFVHAGSES